MASLQEDPGDGSSCLLLSQCYATMVILNKTMPRLSQLSLERFLMRAKRAAGLRGEVNVLLTNSRELRALNARFRKKDRPTDVLSFPSAFQNGESAGDIAISTEIAKENARRLRHRLADEVRILMLHGLLHLAGYDHESDSGAMDTKERRLRKKLGLPVGLIQRTGKSIRFTEPRARVNGTTSKRSKPGANKASSAKGPSRRGARIGRRRTR
jgi:probable rRNA maturation factor